MNEEYQFKERTDLTLNVEDVIESQFIEIETKPSNIIVGIIYRPPNNKFNAFKDSLHDLLQKLDSQRKKCFIMGDFNIDLLKSDENPHVNDFLNQMFSSSFYPLITRPTRITNSSATLIDNIFVNNLEEIYTSGILFTDLSDHLPIFQITGNIQKKRKINTEKKYRQINDKTINQLCQALEKETWLDVFNNADTQEAYNLFYSKFYEFYDNSIPLKVAKNDKYSRKIPWLTKGILTCREKQNTNCRNS